MTAEAYLVVEPQTGRVLLERQAGERRAIASLTKVMTALVTLEQTSLDATVTVDEAVLKLGRSSTRMGIEPGEKLSVRDLLYGLMLPSGNDAAIALARHVAGTEPAFVELMNRKAAALSLRDTHFANSHGLDSRYGDHYSTAYDLARLTSVALAHPVVREIVAARSWTATVLGGEKEKTYEMATRNLLLLRYPGADGVKIGYTGRAGQTLIGSVMRDDRRFLVVVLGSAQRSNDAIILLDRAFQQLFP